MQENLPFGESVVSVELPDRARVIGGGFGTRLAALPDVDAALHAALDAPVGLPRIEELVRPGARVTIAFDDPTVPSFGPIREKAILQILARLGAAGVRDEDVTLLCANSLHRKWTADELLSILGSELSKRFGPRIVCHDAEDADGLVDLGPTPAHGWDVVVHRGFIESDLPVYVNAQCMRGFNGGWKSVCVGLSSWKSIRHHHTPDGMSMSVRRNQMHAMLDEMGAHIEAKTGKRVFKVETILANLFEPAHVFAGSVDATRREALRVLDEQHPPRREAAPPAEVVVYGVPNWSPYATFSKMNPMLTLLSSGLGYFGGAIEALGKPGCSVVLATPCPDQWDEVHHPSYREVWDRVLPSTRDPWEISARFADDFATRPAYVHKYRFEYGFHPVHGILATHPLKRLRHAARVFVAGIQDPALAHHVGFTPTRTVEEAISMAEGVHGPDCAVTCVRQGAGVL